MPIFNRHYTDAERRHLPSALAKVGPILDVEVNIPQPLLQLLTAENKPVPGPVTGWALVDTGASRTCVEGPALASLTINPIGIVSVGTAGGPVQRELFPARLVFPSFQLTIDFGAVISVDLQGQVIDQKPLLVLVGRDVLSRSLFVYSGIGGFLTLAF